MKFNVRHFYVVDLVVEAESEAEALELAVDNPGKYGPYVKPEEEVKNSAVRFDSFEVYDNIEDEASPIDDAVASVSHADHWAECPIPEPVRPD